MAFSYQAVDDPTTSLAMLRKLVQQPRVENLDPYVQAQLDRQDRLDEMKRNLAKVGMSKGSGFATGATQPDATALEGDINDDTDFGAKAHADVLAKQKEYDTGVSYEQPEAQKMRQEGLADKMALAAAPNEATARGSALEQRLKNAGALQLLQQKQAGQQALIDKFSHGRNGSGQNPDLKMGINASGDPTFAQIPITNQTRQMGETSNDILDLLDRTGYEQQAQDLEAKGLFRPGIGMARRFLSQHGMGTLAGVDKGTASQMGQFETTHDLLLSAIARAHAGARGAGNTGMAQRFEKLLSTVGDLPTFLGQLRGMRSLLEQYASRVNPDRQMSPVFGQGESGGGDSTDLGAEWGQ